MLESLVSASDKGADCEVFTFDVARIQRARAALWAEPEIVAVTDASRRVVEMRFRETLQCGIHEELNRLRMEDAKHLLLEHQLSATAIAQACGFSSVHYFSAAFKRDFGISPRQFQKEAARTAPD